MNDRRDALAAATWLACVAVVAWLGLDAWILGVWALSLGVGLVLWLLARLLAKELGAGAPTAHRTHRGAWIAGGVAAFLSCTMAAALVRSRAPVLDFWLLGALMVLAIVDLRLAYTGPRRARGQQS